jgi:hypothetical protein
MAHFIIIDVTQEHKTQMAIPQANYTFPGESFLATHLMKALPG